MPVDPVGVALSLFAEASATLVSLGFGDPDDACAVGVEIARQVLGGAVGHITRDDAPAAWATSNDADAHTHAAVLALLDRVVAPSALPAPRAAELGARHGLVAPLMDLHGARIGAIAVGGEWPFDALPGLVSVLSALAAQISGAVVSCRSRLRDRHVYAELDAARQNAEEHSRAKNRFLARMSHELRTPLNIIIGYSELIGEELQDAREYGVVAEDPIALIRPIHDAGQHLLAIVNDLLDISKLQSGEVHVVIEPTDPAAVVAAVCREVAVLARAQNDRLQVVLQEPLPPCRTDPRKLHQILHNLLSNACKFTADGLVTVRAWSEGEGDALVLWFEVADSGIGISRENLARIFEEFVQVDDSSTRRFGGTGLGLTVSQALARLLGGRISVTSELGQGSQFRLAIRGQLERPSQTPPGVVGARNVVVIGGETSERVLMCRALERAGYGAIGTPSAGAALELVRRFEPCVVVLDATLADDEASGVLDALAALPVRLPVALLTAADAPSGLAPRATAVLARPITRDRFLALITDAVG